MNTILAINLIATNPLVHYRYDTHVADIAIAKVFSMMDVDAIADYYEILPPQVYGVSSLLP